MDGFLYYRVSRPAIQQFARLAINSNEQHPAHHSHATQSPQAAAASPITPSQLHSVLSAAIGVTVLFPAPLVDLIIDYAVCSSLLVGEAGGALHECWRADVSEARLEWRAQHSDALTALTSLSDGQHCATASHDGRIIVMRYSVAAGDGGAARWQEVRRLEHKQPVHALHSVLLAETVQSIEPATAAAESNVPQLQSALVVGSSTGVSVYCPSTGRLLHELSGHTNRVSALCVLPGSSSYPASVLVSASWDGHCRLYSMQSMQCECELRGRGRSLTCVTPVDHASVVAGDVAGGVSVWQFAAVRRPSTAQPTPTAPPSSSIASIHMVGHTSAAYVLRSPATPTPPPPSIPSVAPSSHFSASSAATRAVLAVPSNGCLWVGSDDGLRLFAPSDSGEWLCLRRIVTSSPQSSSSLPVHSLLWLSSRRLAVGMSKRVEVWDCQPLLEMEVNVDSAARVECEWSEVNWMTSVRCLAARHWLDITQPVRPDSSGSGNHHT